VQDLQSIAQQFNVDAGALACLEQFLKDNIAANPQAFLSATVAQRSEIIMQGVKAWHEKSQRTLAELTENRTEWAQAARRHITAEVHARVRSQSPSTGA